MPHLRQELDECLHGRVCFLGLGNVDYGDDAFGVRVAEGLFNAGVPNALVAGNNPDRYIGFVTDRDFDNVIFVDAVEFGGEPGSLLLLRSQEISERFPQFSTHKISIGLLAQCVESNGKTKAWLLGVQPERVNRKEGLSATVQFSCDALVELLKGLLPATKFLVRERTASEYVVQ
jgi:hydrogenase maturation protease